RVPVISHHAIVRLPGHEQELFCLDVGITELKQAQDALRKRLSYEQLLSRVSALSMETDDLYVFQNNCLTAMGEMLDVSRIYIFEYHHETDTMDNTFEWVAEGVLPQKEELQGVSAADIPWWVKMLKSNQVINFSDIKDIPDEGAKTILHHQRILSILVVPLFTAGQYYGFLGFDDCIRHREWSDSDAEFLQAMGRIMTGAIEQKQAEAEKEKLQVQLHQAQKAESLGRMAGAIAHHFNNQLSVVMGNLELVLNDLPDDAENRENLFQSFEAGRKAAEVSQQMLRYLGHISGSQTTINLSDVCRQSLAFLQSSLPNDVTLNIDFPDSGPFVLADAGQIQQVLTNLFTNAQESLHNNQGIIDLNIQTVSYEDIPVSNRFPLDWQPQDIPYACLEISDTGCGMSKEDIVKIFDPFFSTKFTGRGMGLSVIIGILKTHGGCITVDSEAGRGSVFRVYLPVSAEKKR
ncbi:MAG: ATP-binding protein, partial [Desulfotignum sp.]